MKKDQMSRLRLDTLQVSSFSPTELVVLGKKVASNVQGCEYGTVAVTTIWGGGGRRQGRAGMQ